LAALNNQGWLARTAKDADKITTNVGKLVVAAALAVGTLLVLLFLIGRPTRVADWLHQLPVIGRFFAPRLAIGEFKGGKDAAAKDIDTQSFVGALRAAVYRLGMVDHRKQSYSLDGVTAYQGIGPTIGALGDVSPHFKTAGALITLASEIRPRRRFTLSGALRAPTGKFDVTAGLEEKAGVKALTNLQVQTPVAPTASTPESGAPIAASDPVDDLALATAAWAQFELLHLCRDRLTQLTESPQSYAYLGAGLTLERNQEYDAAEDMYRAALTVDPNNIGAWLALGVLKCRDTVTVEGVSYFRSALIVAEGLA
jgi:hypothetical protein